MNTTILQETFSIENVSLLDDTKQIFLSIKEDNNNCVIYIGGIYKCLKIETKYSSENTGILQKISSAFARNNISIFAFTTIDYGYFFFEERFQKSVENNIITVI